MANTWTPREGTDSTEKVGLPQKRMASDHVALNVGGRLFHTTRGTLEFSQAGFFEALLLRWNTPPEAATLSHDFTPEGSPSDQDETSVSLRRPAKRRRAENQIAPFVLVDSESPGGPTVAICSSGTGSTALSGPSSSPTFIDRDPDAFEDVLYFMRCQQIKPSTRVDACRLQQLQIEADFFGYEVLARSCSSSLADLVELHRPVNTVAFSDTLILGNRGGVNRPRKEFHVPIGHVFYVDFASVWGLETLDETRRVNLGFYRRSTERVPAGQRQVRSITILCSSKRSVDNPFAKPIGICISPKEKNDKIGLICAPLMTGILWQVHYWIGAPDKIPQLGGMGSPQTNVRQDPTVALILHQQQQSDESSAAP